MQRWGGICARESRDAVRWQGKCRVGCDVSAATWDDVGPSSKSYPDYRASPRPRSLISIINVTWKILHLKAVKISPRVRISLWKRIGRLRFKMDGFHKKRGPDISTSILRNGFLASPRERIVLYAIRIIRNYIITQMVFHRSLQIRIYWIKRKWNFSPAKSARI